jgi:hypothetical protein
VGQHPRADRVRLWPLRLLLLLLRLLLLQRLLLLLQLQLVVVVSDACYGYDNTDEPPDGNE